MRSPMQAVAVFAIVLLVVTGGALHAPVWVSAAGMAALALVSTLNYGAMQDTLGGSYSESTRVLLLSTVLNAASVSAGAYLTGKLIGWSWGV